LAINIASPTGDAPRVVIPLIGPDLPEGIRRSAEGLVKNPSPGLEGATVDELASHLLEAFLVGITTAAWSPDGRFLAFSGALHGPSSDIYLYDTLSKTIRRLTDGPEHIQKIQWSPDGTWIMHTSALLSFAESAISNHAVKADGTSVITFPDTGQYDRGWLSNSQYLVAGGGPTSNDLAILDLRDGSSRVVWPHTFGALQPNDAGTVILLTTFGDAPDDPPYGLYALDVSDSAFEQLDDFPLWYPAPWSIPPYDFVAVKEGKGLFGVMPDRSIVPVLEGDWWIAISPDHQSLALFGSESSPGVYLLTDLPNSPVKLDTVQPTQVQWSIDSSHLLITRGYATGDQSLLTVDVAAGQPRLIQDLPHGLCGDPSPTWINVR
jgi:dipeptidyl aminopeptidase/acylaminoacyl peptidase